VARDTPQALGRLSGGQPSSVMRWTNSSPTELGQASITMAMRVPSRLEASTTQADRGDPHCQQPSREPHLERTDGAEL
jgi:hypothetical protein